MQEYNDLFSEMTDIKGERTGLPVTIWVSYKIDSYDPRIIVTNDYKSKPGNDNIIALSISDSPVIKKGDRGKLIPEDFEEIVSFIKINHQALLNYWYNFDDDAFDLFSKLKQ
jgi:hypothetical protein